MAGGHGAAAGAAQSATLRGAVLGRDNPLAGRIVLYHDSQMYVESVFDAGRIEEVVAHGVRLLTGIGDTAAAFESLFPDPILTTTTKIAIKVNCIGPTDTRWETVRGIVAGLRLMLGGTYDITNVTIYDNRYIGGHGYTAANFDFDGVQPTIASGLTVEHGYYPVAGHKLCDYLIDGDYLINVPALKSHSATHEITIALKNHYGSCSPANICATGNVPKMLDLNTDANIKGKTALVVTDGLRGTYNGGPSEWPQIWEMYPDQTPNTLFFANDPVTNEYWGLDMINAERALHGWSAKTCSWIETASGDPHYLGISDPGAMTVIHYDPAGLPGEAWEASRGIFLVPNVPNPFRDGTLVRFRLPETMRAHLSIRDISGRLVRDLGEREYAAGYSAVSWDGRNARGRAMPAGVYFATLAAGSLQRTRRILRVR